ncbi:phage tail assembly protein [Paenibacillus sp. 481]|uniref:phage tail assembly protein n=1 Tax=Paenibacillus sp. 481 TaxID=2835869 RepID=UPI001E3696E8|nr:phage tail assembly protein [Paenibacillus sp. 481]UHA74461.1 phage tail assembly protein [Paenibacillus sp. 481]
MSKDKTIKLNKEADERIFELSRPFKFEGQEYTEVLLDLDSLTGDDMMLCERRVKESTTEQIHVYEMSKKYLAHVAACAARVPYEMVAAMPAKDFSKITVKVQGFLLS